ncbi:MAG: hypothetical protein ACO38P_12730, partial [Phycisphaerales bacterium]
LARATAVLDFSFPKNNRQSPHDRPRDDEGPSARTAAPERHPKPQQTRPNHRGLGRFAGMPGSLIDR